MTDMRPPDDRQDCADPGLTRIRDAYTLASTPEQGSETDRLMIDHFLRTLAEVALSVASRTLRSREEES